VFWFQDTAPEMQTETGSRIVSEPRAENVPESHEVGADQEPQRIISTVDEMQNDRNHLSQ